jgi:hypothetical protein
MDVFECVGGRGRRRGGHGKHKKGILSYTPCDPIALNFCFLLLLLHENKAIMLNMIISCFIINLLRVTS